MFKAFFFWVKILELFFTFDLNGIKKEGRKEGRCLQEYLVLNCMKKKKKVF